MGRDNLQLAGFGMGAKPSQKRDTISTPRDADEHTSAPQFERLNGTRQGDKKALGLFLRGMGLGRWHGATSGSRETFGKSRWLTSRRALIG
jgi:hypothetical protein